MSRLGGPLATVTLLLATLPCCAGNHASPRTTGEARRIYSLPGWSGDAWRLEIELPDHLVYKRVKGVDYDVHYLRAADESGCLGVYVGMHPHFQPPTERRGTRYRVGHVSAEFFTSRKKADTLTQGIVRDFFRGLRKYPSRELLLHVMISESTPGFVARAVEGMGTLRLVKVEGLR